MAVELLLDTIPSRIIRPDQPLKDTEHRIVTGAQVRIPGHGDTEPSRMAPGRLPTGTAEPGRQEREVVVTDYDLALGVLAFLREQFLPRHIPARRMNCHGLVRFAVLCALGRTFDLGPDDQLPDSIELGQPLQKTQDLPVGSHVVLNMEAGYQDTVTGDHIHMAHSALTLNDGPDLLQMTGTGGYPALAPADDWAAHLERRYPDAGAVTIHAASYTPEK